MTVRAKFSCISIQKSPDSSSAVVNLSAVTTGSAENESWSKYTPSGQLQMVISNPAAFEQFEQGKEYFIDIAPVEFSDAVKAAFKSEEERNTQDARSVFLSNLDAEITQAYSSLTALLNIRRDATSSD